MFCIDPGSYLRRDSASCEAKKIFLSQVKIRYQEFVWGFFDALNLRGQLLIEIGSFLLDTMLLVTVFSCLSFSLTVWLSTEAARHMQFTNYLQL